MMSWESTGRPHVITLTLLFFAADTFGAGFQLNEHSVAELGRAFSGYGNYVAVYDGATYQFSSAENQKAFDSSPEKYVPAYGGYCAFGTSVGKKFIGDPEVWHVVDGALYLSTGIQALRLCSQLLELYDCRMPPCTTAHEAVLKTVMSFLDSIQKRRHVRNSNTVNWLASNFNQKSSPNTSGQT